MQLLVDVFRQEPDVNAGSKLNFWYRNSGLPAPVLQGTVLHQVATDLRAFAVTHHSTICGLIMIGAYARKTQ